MAKLFVALIAIFGICLGVYAGFWVMFVGGICGFSSMKFRYRNRRF